jgi:hypothetical protein
MIFAAPRIRSSEWLGARIGLVAPAVMAAMVVSMLAVEHDHRVMPSVGEAAAVLGAIVAARRVGNPAVALAVGLPIYWICALTGLG